MGLTLSILIREAIGKIHLSGVSTHLQNNFAELLVFFDISGDQSSQQAVVGGVQLDSSTSIAWEVYQQNGVTGKPDSGNGLKNLGWSQ